MKEMQTLDKNNIEDILPLMPVQEGLLFHYLNETGSEMYFEQLSFRLTGEVDPNIIKKSWDFVVKTNEMLRTVFRWDKIERPIQIVLKDHQVPITEYDLSNHNKDEIREQINKIKEKDRKIKIDISAEPFRIILCKLTEDEYEMVISSYHIIYDGWSNGIILKEFLQAYKALAMGNQPQNIEKNKYKDFIRWYKNQEKLEGKKYWEEHLQNFDTKTLLPTDRIKQIKSVNAKEYIDRISEDLTEKIYSFTRNQNISIASFLYGIWGILLEKYNDEQDVLFGTTVSGRPVGIKNVEEIVGLFINTIPLRIKIEDNDPVVDYLKKVGDGLSERQKFENTPLTEIKTYAEIDNMTNLFDSIVVIENYPLTKALGGQDINFNIKLESIYEVTNYDLTFVISALEDIKLRFIYDTNVFELNTIKRLCQQFESIIRDVLKSPNKRINEIDMLSSDEKRKVLFDFNETNRLYSLDKTIYELFEEQVEKTPNNIAAIFKTENITYKELNEKANKLARLLRKRGATRESIIGIIMNPSIDMVVSLIAILKAGGAYLPIDMDLPPDRILYMLQDAGAKMIIANSDVLVNVPFTSMQNFEANENVEIIVTEPRKHIESFNNLPIPDRSLIDINRYKDKIGMASVNNCITIQTTRGCPYKCVYCHKIWSKHHVHRSAENIYGEIEYYYKNGVRNFAVIDDCFNLDMENSSRLFQLIIKNKLKLQLFFPNGLRGDILTPKYIDLMIEAGTKGINLSLETASPRLQKLLKKNLDLHKFKEVVEYIVTKHPNIILEMATMHGFPTETEEEAMMTLDFIKDIKWLHFPYVHILKVFPNTEMEELALQHGIRKQDILKSKDYAFHELPETLPFSKSFTRKYQANFMNEYFLSKDRLKHVLPVQMKILDEGALIQKYNAYLPIEIKSIEDIINFAGIDDMVIPEAIPQQSTETIFDRKFATKMVKSEAKKVLFLDLSQHFSSKNMLYKVVEQPLGLIYLLTYLKKQFQDQIDGRIYKAGNDFDSLEELKELIDEYKPDMIAIRTLTYYKEFFHETVAAIRQWGVDVPIVTGGPYASSDFDTILKDENVNLVVFGEGEFTFTELVKEMFQSDFNMPTYEALNNIQGIAYRQNTLLEIDKASREVILVDKIASCIKEEDASNLQPLSNADDLAYIMYTSGSTGRPKGVMVEHKQVNNCIYWMQDEFNLTEKDTIVQRTNLSFDPSVWELFWPLYKGAKVKLITTAQGKDADFLIDLISRDSDLTMMYCPASLLTAMTYLLNMKEIKSQIKMPWMIIGAEAIRKDVIKDFYKYFDGKVVNTYGPTECTINNTFYHIDENDLLPIVPIGKPVANNQIYILSKNLSPMPIGVEGEIYIAGDSVGRGYVNNPDKTDENFIKNPFGEGRLYKTGDVGKWLADGNIEISGRVDEQVKIRGYRIELGEIKSKLLNQKSIEDCVVMVRDNKASEQEVKVCRLCGSTSKYPNTIISDDNTCDTCKNMNLYRDYMSKYFKEMKDLDKIIKEKASVKKSKYDCLLVYNGGLGSAYALYRLVEMGYNVLTLTYDNGYFTPSEINNIKNIVNKLGVDNIVLSHKNSKAILKESIESAKTVCKGCFYVSSSLAGEYAYKNNIEVVVGATLSRGQIIENKLDLFYKQGIFDPEYIERELVAIQKTAKEMDKKIFDYIDIDEISDGTVYDHVRFIDFYRYCNITNQDILEYLYQKDSYWETRKDYAIYSTNCAIKQPGDFLHLQEKGYHYYGSATSWEKRLGHISIENLHEDLKCNIKEKSVDNFLKALDYEKAMETDKIDSKSIYAYIVADDEVSVAELKESLSKELPRYMIPSHIIQINSIPLTSNGKIDIKSLPQIKEKISSEVDYVAPNNEVEEMLVEIWQKILEIDKIGTNDNFFDLGGNSILLIQMHALVGKKYPGKVNMTDFFVHTTISEIAKLIQSKDGSDNRKLPIKGLKLPPEYFSKSSGESQGTIYNFNINEEIHNKIKHIAKKEELEIEHVLLSAYIYTYARIMNSQNIEIQTLTTSANSVVSMDIDLSSMSDFITLFKAVKDKSQTTNEKNVYVIDDIESSTIDKEKNSIIPFIYKKNLLSTKLNILNVYDIILEISEEDKGINFTCEYNSKGLASQKIKGLINTYVNTIRVLVDKYKIS